MSYNPLPGYLTISKSLNEGLGLFFIGKVKKDTVIGMSHIMIDGEILRTPLGGFYNHSDKPNCIKIKIGNRWYLKTLRDIELDEELTVKYTFYCPRIE
jgi:SET domain-containing protein